VDRWGQLILVGLWALWLLEDQLILVGQWLLVDQLILVGLWAPWLLEDLWHLWVQMDQLILVGQWLLQDLWDLWDPILVAQPKQHRRCHKDLINLNL
jgi:hypothetical protein